MLARLSGGTSFTILSVSLISNTTKRNGLSWDAVFSCEMIRKYKLLPFAYESVVQLLVMDPSKIMMMACHTST